MRTVREEANSRFGNFANAPKNCGFQQKVQFHIYWVCELGIKISSTLAQCENNFIRENQHTRYTL